MQHDQHAGGRALALRFDRGTITCARTGAFDPGRLPGMRWDERVGAFRAPARHHAAIAAVLARHGVACNDATADLLPAPPAVAPPELRPYQAAALAAWQLEDRRGVVVLPTGSGKTRVALAAIADARGPALCLVPTRVLLEQWEKALAAAFGAGPGCYGDGRRELGPITVATFESAWRHMPRLGNRFALLVVDEAHHFGIGLRDEALEMCTAAHRLGLTATPPAGDAGLALAALIGPVVYELSIGDLSGRYLADFELCELTLDLTAAERERYDTARAAFVRMFDVFRGIAPGAPWRDFVRWAGRSQDGRAALAAWRSSRELCELTEHKLAMVGTLLSRHVDARTLVFTASKAAAYRIAREHLVMPITTDIGRREREAALSAFARGELRALVSARVLNEGFDLPAADCGIVVSGALGAREHTQRIGRLLRPAPGKRALVFELVARATVEVPQAHRRRVGLGATEPARG